MPPVCLIRQVADGLETCPDGLALLQSLKEEPVAVICLAGQYRTGKSFFLNQMCRNSSLKHTPPNEGFVVGPTTESCTRGIWIWDANQRNGRGEKILLMDTEGIASTDNDETYDAKIFSLGLLLSSVFVFNTMGVIDEGAIDRLFLVSELTKHVCIHDHGVGKSAGDSIQTLSDDYVMDEIKSVSEDALAPHFPPFVWLLRDFLLDIQDSGEQLTPNAYLERSLESREGASKRASKRVQERNRIRRSIRTLFTHRECMTLVRPATDEDKLRHASLLPDDELRSEFLVQMHAIRERLLDIARPKRVLNQVIDGTKLSHLVECYVNTMNSGVVPDIKAAWDYVSDVTCEAACFHAIETYKQVMATNNSMAQPEFERVYKEAQEAALNIFKKESVEGEARKRCFQTLKHTIAQDKTQQIAALQQKSAEFCTTLLEKLLHQLVKCPIENGEWDDAKGFVLVDRLAPLFNAYDKDGDGPSKMKTLLHFVKTDLLAMVELLFVRMMNRYDALLENTKKAADETIRESENARMIVEKECHKFQMESTRLIGVVATLEEKLENAQTQIVQLKDVQNELQAQLRTSDEKRKTQKIEFEALKTQHASLENDRTKLQSQLDLTQESLRQSNEEKESMRALLTSQLNEEREERTKERELSISNLAKQAAELHAVQRNLKLRASELEESQRQNTLLTKERDILSSKLQDLLEVHEELSTNLHSISESNDTFAQEKARLQSRCERLEQELGSLNERFQVEIVLERCCAEVVKQIEGEKTIHTLIEEKATLQETLGDLHLKISSLPDFYQRQVFCAEEPVPDFFEALTSLMGK
ncbi:unnamed protein product [Aphanomyces euteiches]